MNLEAHEYADLFPMMSEENLEKLTQSIKENGLRDPIITLDGKILDGRNRYKACQAAGVVPSIKKFAGHDPLSFVIDHNLHRRHLNESQRAMVAAKLANLENGSNRFKKEGASIDSSTSQKVGGPIGPPISKEQAAKDLNVGRTSIVRARRVQKNGSESLVKSVEAGEITVNCADEIRKLPKEEQDTVVEKGATAIKEKAKELRQSSPPATSRHKITQDIGKQTAATAIRLLDKILKDDESREEGLKRVISYCENRLNKNQ